MRYLVLLVIVGCLAGCHGRKVVQKTEPIVGIPCYVIMAKFATSDNQEIIIGPYYSKNRPVTDWQNGDVSFTNMETDKPFVVPGHSGCEIRVTPGFKY